jgi:hypothetical protein
MQHLYHAYVPEEYMEGFRLGPSMRENNIKMDNKEDVCNHRLDISNSLYNPVLRIL